jgi:uncharacterized protein YdaU (DUF1376 family)
MAELNTQQRGVYNSIIDLLYSRDGYLPDNDERIARMISIHRREFSTVKKQLILLGKLWIADGQLHAKRVQETIKDATNFSQTQSKIATKGWQKRRNANQINGAQMPHGNASTATATPRKKDISFKESLNGGEFTVFWLSNPKKKSKERAWKAYQKARKTASHEEIMAGLERAKKSRQWQDPRFIPHPATWLNDKGWEDEESGSRRPEGVL